MIEMEVVGVALEPNTHRPLVWLKDKDQRVFLPIAIGNFEATAIYMELYNEPPPRPITYDLLRSILDGLRAQVTQILINALREDTFYAEITLEAGESTFKIDSRPSDAIALALRVGAPVYVEEDVIREAGLDVEEPSEAEVLESELECLQNEQYENLEGAFGTLEKPGDKILEQVVSLKAKLQEAVAEEEYEKAAKLRDEIGRLEHEMK
ncbi:MAG: DUF151 domain-containing protein [bacterium]|nr:DUF151 domain-containing protein [bacterium]